MKMGKGEEEDQGTTQVKVCFLVETKVVLTS